VGLWGKLKRAAAGGTRTDAGDDGIYFYIRCDRCQDRVRVRLNPASELQQEFGASGDESGYSVRKMVVDQRCFRPIEVKMEFDAHRRERSRHIDGGTFLTREEFEAP
jgi:hypothetical protein